MSGVLARGPGISATLGANPGNENGTEGRVTGGGGGNKVVCLYGFHQLVLPILELLVNGVYRLRVVSKRNICFLFNIYLWILIYLFKFTYTFNCTTLWS